MPDLVIFGAGDLARLALLYFGRDSDYRPVAFTVDRDRVEARAFCDLPLVPFDELAGRYPPTEVFMFVAIGYARMNAVRAEKYAAAGAQGYRLATYVSSRCTSLTEHEFGDNCFILEDNTIQPGVRVGNDVIMWSGNHIGHDATIGDHCFITSHVVVSGRVQVGRRCFLGVNSAIRNGVTIADRTLVGAGAVITADTREGEVWVPPRAVRLEKDSDEVRL